LTPLGDGLKQSLQTIGTKAVGHIQTKNEAVGNTAYIKATRPQMLSLFNHLHSIGADNAVLGDDSKANREVLNKWFQVLVVSNPRFPRDMPVEFVLDEFSMAILQQKVELVGHNLNAHMKAFYRWVDSYGNDLKSKYANTLRYEDRPKMLTETGSVSEEEQKANDHSVSEAVKRMYGDDVPEHLKKFVK